MATVRQKAKCKCGYENAEMRYEDEPDLLNPNISEDYKIELEQRRQKLSLIICPACNPNISLEHLS